MVQLEDRDGGNGELIVFVALSEGTELTDQFRTTTGKERRRHLSPRHVSYTIQQVPVAPRNRTGKKLELPVKRLLQGRRLEDVAALDVLADPTSLDAFVAEARRRQEANSA